MSKEEILDDLRSSVIEYDADKAVKSARRALDEGIEPIKALEDGLGKGIREMGEKFDNMEVYLPELKMAADAMEKASEILTAELTEEEAESLSKGKVLIGTVKGDIHDIGKNLVATMLSANGFKVIDAGVDVPIPEFLNKAESERVDIIALSSLMTTSMDEQRDLIMELQRRGIRGKYKVLIGGGPIHREWADEIGADGYGEDMKKAVTAAKELLED